MATCPDDKRLTAAAQRWLESLPVGNAERASERTALRIVVDPPSLPDVPRGEGYRLNVSRDAIEIIGKSHAGCFYGIQTLAQLSGHSNALPHGHDHRGRGEIPHLQTGESPAADDAANTPNTRSFSGGAHRASRPAQTLEIPCCTIRDWPDFDIRGLLHDVSRGKVPTLTTLMLLADRLAALKANQLQIYIEHAFTFSFDPEICGPDEGLTPDDLRRLDAHCRERFIGLVPAVATFGHMGRILAMPRYSHLAEVEGPAPWEQMTWPQRARGLTLDCTNPEARRLVEHIASDVLDAFSCPVVNICGDEPWDLGKGRSRRRLGPGGEAAAYVEHVRRTIAFCQARGRSVQMFGDVLRRCPGCLKDLPPGVTILHWGYDDATDYDAVADFVDALTFPPVSPAAGPTFPSVSGFHTCVCPGTSGWKRIINAVGLAERNICSFADAGRRHGAAGLINTDWGDHGHFNLLACSWHGIALGAALGWSANHPTGGDFDRRFARTFLGLPDATGIDLLRHASLFADTCETWRLFCLPLHVMRDDPALTRVDEIPECLESARRLHDWCERAVAQGERSRDDLTEIAVAARFTQLLAQKTMIACSPRARDPAVSLPHVDRREWAENVRMAADRYAERWYKRNKTLRLHDILHALDAVAGNVASPDDD